MSYCKVYKIAKKTITGSDVTGWLSGNALDCGLDDPGFESRRLSSTFLGFGLGSLVFSKFFCRINSYSILCPVTGTIDTAVI